MLSVRGRSSDDWFECKGMIWRLEHGGGIKRILLERVGVSDEGRPMSMAGGYEALRVKGKNTPPTGGATVPAAASSGILGLR
jgi:hypothetical protein